MTPREEWREAWRLTRRVGSLLWHGPPPEDGLLRAAYECRWKPREDEDVVETMRDARCTNFYAGWTVEEHRRYCREVLA